MFCTGDGYNGFPKQIRLTRNCVAQETPIATMPHIKYKTASRRSSFVIICLLTALDARQIARQHIVHQLFHRRDDV